MRSVSVRKGNLEQCHGAWRACLSDYRKDPTARADSMSLPTSFVLPADEDVHGELRALPPRAYGGDRDIQRGPFAQVTLRPPAVAGYGFNRESRERAVGMRGFAWLVSVD